MRHGHGGTEQPHGRNKDVLTQRGDSDQETRCPTFAVPAVCGAPVAPRSRGGAPITGRSVAPCLDASPVYRASDKLPASRRNFDGRTKHVRSIDVKHFLSTKQDLRPLWYGAA